MAGAVLLAASSSPPAAAREPKALSGPSAPYQRFLRGRQANGSVSMGAPLTGQLVRGRPMPNVGAHFALLPRTRLRNTRFGTDELVELLRHAAREVALRYPGSRLMVGNLSARRGGYLRYSRSHRSGRDADLAFYIRYRGIQKTTRRYHHFGPWLRARDNRAITFDLERNWALVRALVTHRSIQVQWVIVASHLERALIRHARERGENPRLIQKIQRMLHEPLGIRPHDNHFHVRIYCSLDDRLVGCQDLPPFWPDVNLFSREIRRRIDELLPGLTDPDVHVRFKVLRLLERLKAVGAAGRIARVGLQDTDVRFRSHVLRILRRWRPRDAKVASALGEFIWRRGRGVGHARDPRRAGLRGGSMRPPARDPRGERPSRSRTTATPATAHARPSGGREGPNHLLPLSHDWRRDGHQLRQAYLILGMIDSPAVIPILRQGLRSTRRIRHSGRKGFMLSEAMLAAHAARRRLDARLVPDLMDALARPEGAVRAAAASALRRITNHSFDVRWQGPMSAAARDRQRRRWSWWWQQHRRLSRDRMVQLGFSRRFPAYTGSDHLADLGMLVRITRRQDFLGHNAHERLRRLVGPAVFRKPPPVEPRARSRYWRRWWRQRVRQLGNRRQRTRR